MQEFEILLGLIGLILAILGLLGISIQLRKRILWRKVINAIQEVHPKITRYNPDIIIGLADGMVVAGIIAVNFPPIQDGKTKTGFRPFYTLGVTVQEEIRRNIELLGKEVIPDLSGKRVLLVDCHIYTGQTLSEAIEFLKTKGARDLKTLVLFVHEMEEKICEPDYFAYKIKGKRHKVPWSYSNAHESVYKT